MKTKYNMYLNDEPFSCIKNGTKTVELRLNDEKRQLLKVKDLIEFTNRVTLEVVTVEVMGLYKYSSFEELYKHFDKIAMGYEKDEIANPQDMRKMRLQILKIWKNIILKKNKINMELLV